VAQCHDGTGGDPQNFRHEGGRDGAVRAGTAKDISTIES